VIAHKNRLAKNLTQMLREFPEDYNFFPHTFILPMELNEFKNLVKPKEESNDLSKPKQGGKKDKEK